MNFTNILNDLPTWATTNEALYWYVGFCIGAMVRIFRTALRWVKRSAADHYGRD